MAAPVLDVRPHFDAIKALILAQIPAAAQALGTSVYRPSDVPGENGNPGTLPRIFVLLKVERRFTPSLKASRIATRSAWRVVAVCVGQSAAEAEQATAWVTAALDSQRVTVDGFTSTPVQHETSTAVDRDGDTSEFFGRTDWTYAL